MLPCLKNRNLLRSWLFVPLLCPENDLQLLAHCRVSWRISPRFPRPLALNEGHPLLLLRLQARLPWLLPRLKNRFTILKTSTMTLNFSRIARKTTIMVLQLQLLASAWGQPSFCRLHNLPTLSSSHVRLPGCADWRRLPKRADWWARTGQNSPPHHTEWRTRRRILWHPRQSSPRSAAYHSAHQPLIYSILHIPSR